MIIRVVIPAKAGIHVAGSATPAGELLRLLRHRWMPAFAGMTAGGW